MTYMRVRPADDDVEPDLSITPLRGYRVWRNLAGTDRLAGMTYQRQWRPGTNVAGCMDGPQAEVFTVVGSVPRLFAHPHERAPQADCQCGFYAAASFEMFENASERSGLSEITIAGVVEGFGRVMCHTNGWRAEKARIVAFVDLHATTACSVDECDCHAPSAEYHRALDRLTARFGVPVLTERPADTKEGPS